MTRLLLVAAMLCCAGSITSADEDAGAWQVEACVSAFRSADQAMDRVLAATVLTERSTIKDLAAEVTDRIAQGNQCIARPEVGRHRRRDEAAAAQTATKTKYAAYVAYAKTLDDARVLAAKLDALEAEIRAAAPGKDYAPLVTAQLDAIDSAHNPALPAKWLAHERKQLDSELADYNRRRAEKATGEQAAALSTNTVVSRLHLAPADVFDLAKVATAFDRATATDVVVIVGPGGTYAASTAETDYSEYDRDSKTAIVAQEADTYVRMRAATAPVHMLQGMPALVWNAAEEDGVVHIVGIDGGHYLIGTRSLAPGIGDRTKWPTEPVNAIALDRDIPLLAKLGVVETKQVAAVTNAHDTFGTCSTAIWTANEAGFDQIAATIASDSTKAARVDQLNKRVRAQVDQRCGKHVVAYKAAWKVLAAAYVAKRRATLARVTARLEQLH